jgi:hypothetical protein
LHFHNIIDSQHHGNAAQAKLRSKYPHAKTMTVNATEDQDASGKRFVRIDARVDGKRVKLDS